MSANVQCLAHGIMGSSFVAYGTFMAIMLLIGQEWLIRRDKSQEFYESIFIALWGYTVLLLSPSDIGRFINTFIDHRWDSHWSQKDFQHTAMGIICFFAGILGTFLSFRNGRPQRNVIPAVVIIITGWAMSTRHQATEFLTNMDAIFGYVLMAAGVTRILEITMVLNDKWNAGPDNIRAFQYIPPFVCLPSI